MLLSTDKCLAAWHACLRSILGSKRAMKAERLMRLIIDQAKTAEADKRIADMQPLISTCNPGDDVRAGYWRLEIQYSPIENGEKQPKRSWITTILQPEDIDDEPSSPQARKAVQS